MLVHAVSPSVKEPETCSRGSGLHLPASCRWDRGSLQKGGHQLGVRTQCRWEAKDKCGEGLKG